MMKKLIFIQVLAISLFIVALPAYAHPGNTDKYGCHTCRTNCPKWGLATGEYHCHASKGLPQPEEPIKSKLNVRGGDGYVVPAPEYKVPSASSKAKSVKSVPDTAESSQQNPVEPVKVETPKAGFWKKMLSWLF